MASGALLTDTQREIMRFIRAYIYEHKYSPSIRDIVSRVSVSSTNTVAYNLHALEKKGYIARDRFKARTIRVL